MDIFKFIRLIENHGTRIETVLHFLESTGCLCIVLENEPGMMRQKDLFWEYEKRFYCTPLGPIGYALDSSEYAALDKTTKMHVNQVPALLKMRKHAAPSEKKFLDKVYEKYKTRVLFANDH